MADFFFTHCPTICPGLTRNMRLLQQSINNAQRVGDKTPDFLHLLSFSIDPERDSVDALRKYADRYGVNHDTWWMLTGPKKAIYDQSINEFKLGLQDVESVDTGFIHTTRFVLMDKERVIRGYYNGLDSNDMSRLAEDIVLLMLEKDKKKKRKIF